MPVHYFSMQGCAPCKAFQPVLQKTAAQMGVHVNYIDVNAQPQLASQYNISSVPTLVITSQTGETLYRASGALSPTQLSQILSMSA